MSGDIFKMSGPPAMTTLRRHPFRRDTFRGARRKALGSPTVTTALMVGLGAVTLAVVVKIGVLLQYAVWNWRNGESVVNRVLTASPQATPSDFSFEEAGKAVIDLGGERGLVGVYPHAFWIVAIKPFQPVTALGRTRSWLRFLLSIWLLAPVASLLLVLASCGPQEDGGSLVGYACSLSLVFLSLASAVGTGVGAITSGPFNWILLGLPAKYRTPAGHVLGNVSAFVASLLFFWISAAAALTFTSVRLQGVVGLAQISDPTFGQAVSRFVLCLYEVPISVFGVAGVDADSPAARGLLLAILITALAWAAFLIGLVTEAGAVTGGRQEHTRPASWRATSRPTGHRAHRRPGRPRNG